MTEMTARQRYQAVTHFEPGVRTLLWEFAYWNGTAERWYAEGLQRTSYSPPPGLPIGEGLYGEAIGWPARPGLVRYRDSDVHNVLGFDEGAVQIPLNWRHCPPFPEQLLEEDSTTRVMINSHGVKVRVRKGSDSIPQHLEWPVFDGASWEHVKQERFGRDIMPRFPERWGVAAETYRTCDCPVGVLMDGFFSIPRELLGVTRQLMMYYDDPQLMHDINDHLCRLWLAMLEETLSDVHLDYVYVWEDMAFKNGPLLSPRLFGEFIVPCYERLTAFLKQHGVDTIFVDTDGDCRLLIPGFLRAGVTGLHPFEAQAGMDVAWVRRNYPGLLMQGGIDKMKVAAGKETIDAELEAKLPFVLARGGYIPFVDHLVPPDVSWENFRYYRQRVREYVEHFQQQ
jgi:hypothetical protein